MNELIAGVPNLMWIIGSTVLLMWLLFCLDAALGGKLHLKYAVYPLRPKKPAGTANGVLSFFTAPFFHGNMAHLISNTLLFIFSARLVLLTGERVFFVVTPVLMVVCGAGLKIFGQRPAIGMSGVIIGYVSYALSIDLFTRNSALVVLGAIFFILTVLLLEAPRIDKGSGILNNILPTNPEVFKVGHFFGFVGGLMAACVMSLVYAYEFNL